LAGPYRWFGPVSFLPVQGQNFVQPFAPFSTAATYRGHNFPGFNQKNKSFYCATTLPFGTVAFYTAYVLIPLGTR